ncbi:MAG: hypothetical protein J6U22_06345 [Bacteroidaceae bacterium]|nr:hypothetical protein [Bacteroidaceae bacterium]
MKKLFLMMLIGATQMIPANAQQGLGGMVLDSTYTTNGDGIRESKTVYEYNSDKQLTATYDYSYGFIYDSNIFLSGRTLYTYDVQGHPLKQETYEYEDDQYILTGTVEFSEWNEDAGMPAVTVIQALDEDDPSAGLQPYMKNVIRKFHGKSGPEDTESFSWDKESGSWIPAGGTKAEFDSHGNMTKETVTMTVEEEGVSYSMDIMSTYEYDSHGNVTKEISSSLVMGFDFGTTEKTYVNEYYPDGNLKKVTETEIAKEFYGGNQDVITIKYYFWSAGGTSGIKAINKAQKALERYHDLNGNEFNGTPSEKGLFIRDGKLILNR